MFGKKILINIVIIIILVLFSLNTSNAGVNPKDIDISQIDENFNLSLVPTSSVIMREMIIMISSLILESINIVMCIVLLKKETNKKGCILIILINIIMGFINIRFAFDFDIWSIIKIVNLMAQIILIIYLIRKIFTIKKEGEKKCQE